MTRFPAVKDFRGFPWRGVPNRGAEPTRRQHEGTATQAVTGAFEHAHRKILLAAISIASWVPDALWAQLGGGGPFSTGAANFQANLLTILAPIAVIGVMVIGVAAWFNKISWGWAAAAAGGLILVFGAPQIVAWVRGMAGV